MKQFIFYIFTLSLLVACMPEQEKETGLQEVTRFTATFSTESNNSIQTRTPQYTIEGEDKVEDIRMLLFDNEKKLVENVFIKPFTGTFTHTFKGLSGNYFIHFIANSEAMEEAMAPGMSYEDVSQLSTMPESTPQGGITPPMTMVSDSIAVKLGTKPEISLGEIPLKRTVARITIMYENNLQLIDSVLIEGTAQRGKLLRKATTSDGFKIKDKDLQLLWDNQNAYKVGYYYVYPTQEDLHLEVAIGKNIKKKTLPGGTNRNGSYILRVNNSSLVESYDFAEENISYSPASTTFDIKREGGQIDMTLKQGCTLTSDADWLQITAQGTQRSVDNSYRILATKNDRSAKKGKLTVSDPSSGEVFEFTLKQEAPKYMVVAVGGQSNAVGFDESAVDLNGTYKTDPRALQLSYRRGIRQPNLDIIPVEWCSDDMFDPRVSVVNVNGLRGVKGIHQPLAKQLLEKFKGTPYEDYDIMVVPVGFGGTAFTIGNTPDSYNDTEMHPTTMNPTDRMRWGKEKAFARTMVDRITHVLKMNDDSKFLGVVWSQGESDKASYKSHYQLFDEMTADIFDKLNKAGIGTRTAKGVVDKDSWYVFSSPVYYADYYLGTSAAQVFAGYKTWNPGTFVYITPKEEYTNVVGGNGAAAATRNSHYGNDAYRTVVAPEVIKCMEENGSLFNGKRAGGKRFKDATTPSEAAMQWNNMTEADLKDLTEGLIVHLPFKNQPEEELCGTASVTVNGNVGITSSIENLHDINGGIRTIRAINLDASGKGIEISNLGNHSAFSVSVMVRRNAGMGNNVQRILTMGNSALEYKALTNTTLRRPELMFEPVVTTSTQNTVVAQFTDAVTVRSENEWVHILVTHDATKKQTRLYLNGQLVNDRTMTSLNSVNFNQIVVGEGMGVSTGIRGEISSLMLWDRPLSANAARRVFLESYYGYSN